VWDFIDLLQKRTDEFYKPDHVRGLSGVELAQRVLDEILRQPGLSLDQLSQTASEDFRRALQDVRGQGVPGNASEWLLTAANAMRVESDPPFTDVRALAKVPTLWASPPLPLSQKGVVRLTHCVVALKWAAERVRGRSTRAPGELELPMLESAGARRQRAPCPSDERRMWRCAVARLLGALGRGTAGRDDARDDDFAKEFLVTLSSQEEHTTVDALCSALCSFAAGYRAGPTAKPLTKCDLGVGDSAEAATAADYETAFRSFVATLLLPARVPRYEGGATAAVGMCEREH
jgi:hypothetical protein